MAKFKRYEAPDTVAAFMESNAFVRILKGPFGSGKSSGCIVEMPRRAREQEAWVDGVRRTRFAVVRNTYRELEDTTRKTFDDWLGTFGEWREKDFAFDMMVENVESEILFRALDKPADVKKLLSLELTGAYLNEIREIPKQIFDALQGRVGRYPSMKDGGPTWSGIWGDTNPWHTGHWGNKLFSRPPADFAREPIRDTARPGVRLRTKLGAVFELYNQPGGLDRDAENRENLPENYYELLCAGKDTDFTDVYVHGKDARNDQGSIFGKWVDAIEARGDIAAFDHPRDQFFTFWDLGIGDATAIWFFRFNDQGGIDFIDHYSNSGEGASHYFEVVDQRGYQVLKHWLPHDGRNRTFQTGVSVLQQFQGRFGADRVAIAPQLSLRDGIGAARWLLEQPKVRFHSRCEQGLDDTPSGMEALREYRFEWDPANHCFSSTPLHNWASHSADAFRGAACVVKVTDLLRPKPAAKPVIVTPELPTMNELWREMTKNRRRERS